jgi:hypothetical protein
MEWLTIVAAIAGIVGVIYMILIGQKSIPEILQSRFGRRHLQEIIKENDSSLLATDTKSTQIRDNLPPRPKLIGRVAEIKQLRRAILSL